MAACSAPRSFVSDCRTPLDSPVRTIATRSVGSSPRSTNRRSALPGIVHAYDGESQIIDDENNRAPHLLARDRRRRHPRRLRCGGCRDRTRRDGPGCWRSDRDDGHELRERDLLPLAVLEDFEIRGGQVANHLSRAIGDNRVDRHDVDGDSEPGRLRGRLACGDCRRRARNRRGSTPWPESWCAPAVYVALQTAGRPLEEMPVGRRGVGCMRQSLTPVCPFEHMRMAESLALGQPDHARRTVVQKVSARSDHAQSATRGSQLERPALRRRGPETRDVRY